jgi:FkbM family methyltransferase
MGRRLLKSYFSWRALWHVQFVPKTLRLFEHPISLLGNYIGIISQVRSYRTRAGQCFSNVFPVETEAILGSFVKHEYGDIDVNGDVIDIGANIGAFSLYAACRPRTKRVLAFEPMNETFKRLVENVTASVAGERIVCIHAAVSSRSGFVQMISGANSMLHRSSEVFEGVPESRQAVPAVALGSVFESYNVANCALLKLDCEGAEFEILENLPPLYFQRIHSIRLEIHQRSDGRTPDELFRFVESQGFTVEKPLHYGVIWFRRLNTS